jgi:hypothetical protein
VSPPSNFLEIEMTTEIETGGPAYPIHGYSNGLMIRDYFAGLAMQGRMAGNMTWRDLDYKPVNGLNIIDNEAALAYQMADAMIAARK